MINSPKKLELALRVLNYLEGKLEYTIDSWYKLFRASNYFIHVLLNHIPMDNDFIPLITGTLIYYIFCFIEDVGITRLEGIMLMWINTKYYMNYTEHEWQSVLIYLTWGSKEISYFKVREYFDQQDVRGWWS